MSLKKKKKVVVLKGWRLELFKWLIEDDLMEIKKGRLVGTDKLVKIISDKKLTKEFIKHLKKEGKNGKRKTKRL